MAAVKQPSSSTTYREYQLFGAGVASSLDYVQHFYIIAKNELVIGMPL